MTYATKENLKQMLRLAVSMLIGIAIGMISKDISRSTPTDCHDYTLNQYEAGDVPVKCIDQFLEENK